MRLAWLPDDETLLRVEAGITALQPMLMDDDSLVGFEPPTLTSLRCDMLKKVGELDNTVRPFRDEGEHDEGKETKVETALSSSKEKGETDVQPQKQTNLEINTDSPRDSLSL
mmetsp:Transcript_32639/g.54685  ORF Transcript_32639/g.54685 Transcript_32639/m.54685 type:complete len:112 (-) Transcript_32639:37-372(-)